MPGRSCPVPRSAAMRIPSPARLLLLLVLACLLSGCGYNQIQQKDEAVKAGWSEVINQYKRRADLIPNLVNTVKGYALARGARAHRGDRGARQGQPDQRQRQRRRVAAAVPAGAGRAVRRAVATAGRDRELSATSRPTSPSATCRRSWKAPRTASRSRAAATSRRCRTTTPTSARSRRT